MAHRLRRYAAGQRLDYDDLTAETLAAAIESGIRHGDARAAAYRPVDGAGAARAAALLADLL